MVISLGIQTHTHTHKKSFAVQYFIKSHILKKKLYTEDFEGDYFLKGEDFLGTQKLQIIIFKYYYVFLSLSIYQLKF